MALTTKDFVTLVREQVTAIQSKAKILVDLTIGSILRALVESNAAMALWLQSLILQLLTTTRAATASETDLDTWMADYGLTRLPAVAAAGFVTFARFTPAQQAIIPIGVIIQTTGNSVQYAVTLDRAHSAYSEAFGGYILPIDVKSIQIPVTALIAGNSGNVAIGAINTLTTAVIGVDTVINESALTNGYDAESDGAFRLRFVAYLASLSKATREAVGYAVISLKTGLNYTLIENETTEGINKPGFFYILVDDGTGVPSTDLLTEVYNAVDAVRPLGVGFAVLAPEIVTANVSLTISVAPHQNVQFISDNVTLAIKNYLNTLALNQPLAYSRLAQVAYDVSPAITNVKNITLNGANSDLTVTRKQVIKAGKITVTYEAN